jgi:hypothetical protein
MADAFGPLAQSLARWRVGMLAVRLGDPDGALVYAEAMAQIVAQKCVVQGDGPSRYFRGWALAHQGDPARGLSMIRDGLERHTAIGMLAHSTEVMGYAVDALVLMRDWDRAQRQLDDAFAKVRELDEREYLSILLIQQARIALGRGERDAAYRTLRESVAVARAQEAPGFELKCACELVEHPDSTPEDRAALAALVSRFAEGLDTSDFKRARALV